MARRPSEASKRSTVHRGCTQTSQATRALATRSAISGPRRRGGTSTRSRTPIAAAPAKATKRTAAVSSPPGTAKKKVVGTDSQGMPLRRRMMNGAWTWSSL
jgi:hypothetical protein